MKEYNLTWYGMYLEQNECEREIIHMQSRVIKIQGYKAYLYCHKKLNDVWTPRILEIIGSGSDSQWVLHTSSLLNFYVYLNLKCCNFIFGCRNIAILFLLSEMMQFYFCFQKCCNFIFAIRGVKILFLLSPMMQFYLSKELKFHFYFQNCCNFIFAFRRFTVSFLLSNVLQFCFLVR